MTHHTADIITIGDTSLDVFLDIDEATLACDISKEHCRLCFNYADKIPVTNITYAPGGNACNTAVGFSRLGLNVGMYTILGDDDSGISIFREIKNQGVSTDYIRVEKQSRTNYSTILHYKGDRTILAFHEDRKYRLPRLAPAKWLYFSSVAKKHNQLYKEMIAYIKKTKASFAFNPGMHQLREGITKIKSLVEIASIFIVNKEEAEKLCGETEDIKKLLKKLRILGPSKVIITDGQKGAYAYDGAEMYFLKIFPAPVVERTGCGDAFACGTIAALVSGEPLAEALRWGSINSAHVLGHIGSQKGLVKRAHMKTILQKHPRYTADIIS